MLLQAIKQGLKKLWNWRDEGIAANKRLIEFETKCHAHLKKIGWDSYGFWIILEDPNKKNHQDILIIAADDEQ